MSVVTFGAGAQVKNPGFQLALQMMLSKKTPTISVADAAAKANKFVFLDAREPAEFEVSHIKNAKYVGDKGFSAKNLASIAKSTPLVVYCSVGKRSENATLALKKAGFTNVKNLYGGIFEWVNTGNKVYNMKNQPTDSVHVYSKFWGRWLDKGEKIY